MQKLLWTIILCLGFSFTLQGKKIPIFHLTVENGLPSNTVYSITKQHNGYLWFSTTKGLSRYNGISFQNFSTFDGLPDNDILNTTEDGLGRLWLSTFGGYLCYYKDDTFHVAQNTPWLKLPFNLPMLRNCIQRDGSINTIFSNSSKFIRIKNNEVHIIPIKGYQNNYPLNVTGIGKENFELIGLNNRWIINSSGEFIKSVPYKEKGDHYLLVHNTIDDPKISFLTDKGVYDMNENALLTFKKTKITFKNFPPGLVDKDNIFIGLLDGVSINDSIFIELGERPTVITKDKDENYWIPTLGKGVFYLSKYFKELAEYNDAYTGKVMYARLLHGNLYFVTSDGSLYRKKQDVIERIYKSNKINAYFTKSNFLITDEGKLITVDGVDLLISSNIEKDIPGKPVKTGQYNFSIKEILQGKQDVFFVNISRIMRLRLDSFAHNGNAHLDTLMNDDDKALRIYSRAFDASDASLWYSQKNRVSKITNDQNIVQAQFKNTTFRAISFFDHYLVGIKDNNALAIYGNYKTQNIKEQIISLPNCIWENIIPINNHSALISTNNYYRLLLTTAPKSDGTPQYTIQTIESPFLPQQAEYVVSDSANSYFFRDGTITFIPNKVFLDKTLPPVPVFQSLKTTKKSYAIRDLIEVPYADSRNVSIQIDNISFASKTPTTQYSISVNDKENWIEMSGNEINMSSPGFGKYIIKVRSKTISSAYSSPITITLIIDKPFWATWWFITLSIALLILLVYGIILFFLRRNLRKKQKEYDAEFKYQQSEYKALNALMNPHFIFNSLNNIQGLINKDDKDTANQYLVIFSHLIRQNMKNVSLGLISLEQEMHLVGNYLSLEKLRFKDLVNFNINIDPDVEIDDIMIPPLLIQPLVENAILHGLLPKQSESSKVEINVFEKGDTVYISVKDNGIGLTASLNKRHGGRDSYGLLNMNKRIEHLKKFQHHEINFAINEIINDDGTVFGTESIITIELQ